MNVLRAIHAALVPGGILIDTQPVSARPPIESDGRTIGTLDMTDWAGTIAAVDARVREALAAGLFEVEEERRLVVTDAYDDGAELAAEVAGWAGTRLDAALAASLASIHQHLRLHQDVRLRVLRARP